MNDKEYHDLCVRYCIDKLFVMFIALFVVLNDKLFICLSCNNEIELFIVDLFC